MRSYGTGNGQSIDNGSQSAAIRDWQLEVLRDTQSHWWWSA
jgi:hypothetical protein